MFIHSIAGALARPRHLSSDHDPLCEFHRWKPNLRILNVTEIKTVPEVPLSHPFVERLVGTMRREFLDQIPFWSATDLERKLLLFRDYYNSDRVHASLSGVAPACKASDAISLSRVVSVTGRRMTRHRHRHAIASGRLAETIIALYKTELIHLRAPWLESLKTK